MKSINLGHKQQGNALMFTALIFMLICGFIVYSNFKVSKSIVFDSYNQLAKTETYHAAQAAVNIVIDELNEGGLTVISGSTDSIYEIMETIWQDSSEELVYQKTEESIETKVYMRFVKEVIDSKGDKDGSNSNTKKGLFELVAISETKDNRNATTKLVVGILTD